MRYYGCKEKILDLIEESTNGINKDELVFIDLFAGTTSVGQMAKKKGFKVISNDIMEYSYALSKTYIELNSDPIFLGIKNEVKKYGDGVYGVISYLNNLNGFKGFIYDNYSEGGHGKRQYFSSENGQKIDAIRNKIYEWEKNKNITENEKYYLISSLILSCDKVANVSGTYGSFLKSWDNRALKTIKLLPHELIDNGKKNKAYKEDGLELIKKIKGGILYLDPPYNTRQYASNYFLLEIIAEGRFDKKPEIYGHTGMRPYEAQKSKFCSKKEAKFALDRLIENSKVDYILLSYSNEGIIENKDIEYILKKYGNLEILTKNHKRYKSINQEEGSKTLNEYIYKLTMDYDKNKRMNNLNGKERLQLSFTIRRDIKKDEEERKLKHPAIFPSQLVERLINVYTKHKGSRIFDPFLGTGGTTKAAYITGMQGIGCELNSEFAEIAKNRCKNIKNTLFENNKEFFEPIIHNIDSINMDKYIEDNSIDLVVTSPPYRDILNMKRSVDTKSIRNYSDSNNDIGNIESYEDFLNSLKKIYTKVYNALKPNKRCCCVVMDIRKKDKFYPFHIDQTKIMEEIGFELEELVIWDRQHEYNNMKTLGYPYVYRFNKVHEYICIYWKR